MQKCFKKFVPLVINHVVKNYKLRQFNNVSLFKNSKFYFSNTNTNQAVGGLTPEDKKNIDYIESGVFELLKNSPKCKQDKLSRTASLEDLGFDSLDIVELVIAVEEKFNITIADDDSVKINTVQDMIQMFYNYHTGKIKKPEPSTGPSGTI